MIKQGWMYEIEYQHGWRDLWPGAWVRHPDGRWARFETLADIWPWSDWLCDCCNEPLLITPDCNHLACRWSAKVTLFGSDRPYQLSGISAFPCLRCYSQAHQQRTIYHYKTTRVTVCRCGLTYKSVNQTAAMDFLPVGYVCRGWIEQSREDQINGKLDQIQLMLKEQRR